MLRHRVVIVLYLILLYCCVCSAQQASSPGDHGLQGTVINALTGAAIPHASVQIADSPQPPVLTGATGEFAIDAAPQDNRYVVHVHKPGFSKEGAEVFGMEPFKVPAGSGPVVLKMVPECVISGQVTDADGEPLEGAEVRVFRFEVANGVGRIRQMGIREATDDEGNFRVPGLSAGKYYVAAGAANVARMILGVQSGKHPQNYPLVSYYPAGAEIEAASAIDLAAGQHVALQLSLSLVPAFKISGTIAGISDLKPKTHPFLSDASGTLLVTAETFDSTTGKFEFRAVPKGNYRLRLLAEEKGRRQWIEQPLVVRQDIADLKVRFRSEINIPIIVNNELSERPAWVCTLARELCDRPSVSARLRRASSTPRAFEPGSEYDTYTSGSSSSELRFSGILPGKYFLEVEAMPSQYVSSVRSGGADLLREVLVVPSEGSVPPIQVTVRNDCGTLNIHVSSDQPARSAVLLVSESLPRQKPLILFVDTLVGVEYRGMAPGDYKVFAFDFLDRLEYTNPEALARYSSKAAHVSVSAKATSEVSLQLVHNEE